MWQTKLILVPGIGFGGEVFDSLMEANKDKYTMYAITPAGFGGTQAPLLPDTSVTYSRIFMWYDNPKGTYDEISDFVSKKLIQ